jgi:hypothetical protein
MSQVRVEISTLTSFMVLVPFVLFVLLVFPSLLFPCLFAI